MRFLGIDIGGTFIKAAVLDVERMKILDSVRTEFPPFTTASFQGQREVPLRDVLACCRQALEHVARKAGSCSGVLVAGQMGGLVLLDDSGHPRSDYISWQDMRAEEGSGKAQASANALKQKLSDEQLFSTGNDFRASNPLKELHWLMSYGQLADNLIPASIMSSLIAHLCGTVPSLHATDAAAFGCLDLQTSKWNFSLLGTAGLADLKWPSLVSSMSEPVGEWSINGRSIPLYPAVGDQQAALVGACLSEEELSVNIATGSQVSQLSRSILRGEFQVRPYFDDYYLSTITHIPAGRALQALLVFLGSPSIDWTLLEAAVNATPETTLDVKLSFFPSACGSRGHIQNMNEQNMTLGHILRAAFKNMAGNYFTCAGKLPDIPPRERIVFSGGLATRFGALRKEIVSLFEVPVRLAPHPEDALYGLMLIAKSIAAKTTVGDVTKEVAQSWC
jgi:sugar (pentulose or hexulose) kinase